MATRLTLADGLGFLAALLELHATPPGQAAVGEHDNWHWKLGQMPGNDSANACRTMVYTLRRGLGLFVCQSPELFLRYPELLLKYSELFLQYPELFPKYPLLLLKYPEQFLKYPKLVLKHSKNIQKIVQNHSKIPPKNTHSYFQTSSSHLGSNVGPFTWWG